MKTKISLLIITVIALFATAVFMTGCGCSDKKAKDDKSSSQAATVANVDKVPTDKVAKSDDGVQYVEDNFPTISPTKKTTDDNGNTVITYTDSDGSKVKKTITKDGVVKLVIKDKNGKVIKKRTYKSKTEQKKIKEEKESKQNNKKSDNKKSKKKSSGSDDGWSDFY